MTAEISWVFVLMFLLLALAWAYGYRVGRTDEKRDRNDQPKKEHRKCQP